MQVKRRKTVLSCHCMKNLPRQIGNYILERKIGRGGTSEVWLARHASLHQRRVAVKILMTHDDESLERFRREANIASQLHHSNIVQIYDHGSYTSQNPPGQLHCTILEYVHGGSLQEYLERHGSLSLSDAVAIFQQIAGALDYAHTLDIVHRDVSPGNVLLEQSSGRALLTDFGIARDLSQKITVHSAIMGTPGYWSPEHTQSATVVTHLSDIYSLGVVLYAMLSGALPWDENDPPATRSAAPPPLRERGGRQVPPEIDRIIRTLLANDPAKRYPSAAAAAAELEQVIERHDSFTHIVSAAAAATGAPPATDALLNDGSHDPVALLLRDDLRKEPMAEAAERAVQLDHPDTIADLLDDWAAHGRLRLPLLGRLARIHQIESHNIYFYELRVLYEQRGEPAPIEEPDYTDETLPLEPARDRWQVELPQATAFANDDGGQLLLPGSLRVVSCPECSGKGKIVCATCTGKGRIYTVQAVEVPDEDPDADLVAAGEPAAMPARRSPDTDLLSALLQPTRAASAPTATRTTNVLVPCPECEGQGGLPCVRCDAMGRLLQKQAFRWQRIAYTFADHDELPAMYEKWVQRTCATHEIYAEQMAAPPAASQTNPQQPASAAFRKEWLEIPPIRCMIEQAQAALDEDTRIVLTEVRVRFLPVTDVVFDLTSTEVREEDLYRLSIYGFENAIPSDWRFLDWERVLFLFGGGFLLTLVLVLGFFILR